MKLRPDARRAATALMLAAAVWGAPVGAETTPYTRSVAEAVAKDEAVAAFYRDRNYRPLWTGPQDGERRAALFQALSTAADHGLPVPRYDATALIAAFRSAVTEGDRGRLEARMTRAYLDFAHDLQGGVLTPAKVDSGIVLEVVRRDETAFLAGISGDAPQAYLAGLAPKAPEYARLMAAKFDLEQVVANGGWGAKVGGALRPGATGARVVALRDRLAAMGYLGRSATAEYDRQIQSAVQRFQADHGIVADGIADADTVAQLDVEPDARLASVIVAMERLRWIGDTPRGKRHIWVNLPEMVTKIVDDGQVVFQTRSVIGKDVPDQRTPEFSDSMQFMVVNPSWSVPRSITTKEYLPLLQRNPNAVSHLQVIDQRGRVVPRGAVNFAQFSARSFPYALRQPPSDGNALGKVKFMFPNKHNIYLHDTPAKSLFDNDVRAYSHGCIRLSDPFDFAYALLARQTTDPQGEFQGSLATRNETRMNIQDPVPVHLVYFTAWPGSKGRIGYRDDIYGRDARIFDALRDAGVVAGGVQG